MKRFLIKQVQDPRTQALYSLDNVSGYYIGNNKKIHLEYLASRDGYKIIEVIDQKLSIPNNILSLVEKHIQKKYGNYQFFSLTKGDNFLINWFKDKNRYHSFHEILINEEGNDLGIVFTAFDAGELVEIYYTIKEIVNQLTATVLEMEKNSNKLEKKTTTKNNKENESKQSTFFSKFQEEIINSYPRAIRFEKLMKTGRKDKTYSQFLERFFTEFNKEKNTIYVDNSEVQTDLGRRRSIGDIFMLVKYYYPNVTLQEVYRWLSTEFRTKLNGRSSKCGQIHKYVYYVNNQASAALQSDDFGEWKRSYDEILKELKKIYND